MRVLDLFSGLGGFSRPFADRGHEVWTVDIDERFKPWLLRDVRELMPDDFHGVDVVLASPPCERFSVASISHYWKQDWYGFGVPRGPEAEEALALVRKTLELIHGIAPKWWVMENPRGMLRKVIGIRPKETVFLCSFGDTRMKPTDLWGLYPGFVARPCGPHAAAPRGSKTPGSTQGIKDRAERALLPYGLGEELCRRIEAA